MAELESREWCWGSLRPRAELARVGQFYAAPPSEKKEGAIAPSKRMDQSKNVLRAGIRLLLAPSPEALEEQQAAAEDRQRPRLWYRSPCDRVLAGELEVCTV